VLVLLLVVPSRVRTRVEVGYVTGVAHTISLGLTCVVTSRNA
jgi:hypothetical protein